MERGDSELSVALESSESARWLLRASADALLDPQVLGEAAWDSAGRVVDFVFLEVNRAAVDYLGRLRVELLGRGLVEIMPGIAEAGLFVDLVRCVVSGEPVSHDDLLYDNEMLGVSRRYDVRAARATANSISVTWRDVTERFDMAQQLAEARIEREKADALYRRLVDHSGTGIGLLSPDGRFEVVNPAMCDFFGYDARTLRAKSWQELTASDYLLADLSQAEDTLSGHIDSYRMKKQYIHADGHRIWGDLSVSCLRKPNGEVENFISQIIDITAEMEARQLLVKGEEEKRLLAERLATELGNASNYVASILPRNLAGPVRVSSSHLPSQELAGDCFDYRWIDDDHLIVYLIDVSGHGIGPALLTISVHNLLRSGSLPATTLLTPEKVLSELNQLFQMEDQDWNYFTMWFGVYELSSRTLRYASAGAPPAIAVTTGAVTTGVAGAAAELLATDSQPIGMFADTVFPRHSYTVEPGCRILVSSDGAFELPLGDGRQFSLAEFTNLYIRLAGSSDLSLDALVESLRSLVPSGTFDDDCSLVLLEFD